MAPNTLPMSLLRINPMITDTKTNATLKGRDINFTIIVTPMLRLICGCHLNLHRMETDFENCQEGSECIINTFYFQDWKKDIKD